VLRSRRPSPERVADLLYLRRAGTITAVLTRDRRLISAAADQESGYRAIESLIATYADRVDDGDFATVGLPLADATFAGAAGSVSGRHAIDRMLVDNIIVYDDGTPRTKHVITNLGHRD
jgi:hypothetical protein